MKKNTENNGGDRDIDEDRRKRSQRMVKLLASVKGEHLKHLPVPPFTKWLDGRILDVSRGTVEIEFVVREEMANPTGLLHGGMQCAMIDDVIGMTGATLGYKGFLINLDIHVDYLGKVKVGETVRATGKIIREGRTIIHATVNLETGEGDDRKLVATGGSNLLVTSYKPEYIKNAGK